MDLGCGTGVYLNPISLVGEEIYGCDLSSIMLNHAKKKHTKVKFTLAAAENLPYPQNYFDVVFCFNSFYHFHNQRKALKEISRVLKKDGRAYIEFYNLFHPFVLIRRSLNFIASIDSRGSSVYSLKKLCRKIGFKPKFEVMSYVECSSSVKKFMPSFLFNLLKRFEKITLPKPLFFRGMLICKKGKIKN